MCKGLRLCLCMHVRRTSPLTANSVEGTQESRPTLPYGPRPGIMRTTRALHAPRLRVLPWIMGWGPPSQASHEAGSKAPHNKQHGSEAVRTWQYRGT